MRVLVVQFELALSDELEGIPDRWKGSEEEDLGRGGLFAFVSWAELGRDWQWLLGWLLPTKILLQASLQSESP